MCRERKGGGVGGRGRGEGGGVREFTFSQTYPLTASVVGAAQMISHPVSSHFFSVLEKSGGRVTMEETDRFH